MNSYKCFTPKGVIDLKAESSYDAQVKAAKAKSIPASKQYLISVVLLEVGGTPIQFNPASLG